MRLLKGHNERLSRLETATWHMLTNVGDGVFLVLDKPRPFTSGRKHQCCGDLRTNIRRVVNKPLPERIMTNTNIGHL